MMSDATMKDVARRAGVSVATVSRVLNGSDKVIDETRKAFCKPARNLTTRFIWQPKDCGLEEQTRSVLCFLVLNPAIDCGALTGVQEALLDSNLDLIPYSVGSPEMRDRRIHDLANRSRTDGLLIISMPINDIQTERFN